MKRGRLARKIGYNIHSVSSHKPLQEEWKEMWNEIKQDIDVVLRQGSLTIGDFAQNFKSLSLTADPRVFFRFSPTTDSLLMNAWAAMYHAPFEIAGTLVHENDHREFHRENGTIGASYEVIVEFQRNHSRDSEVQAFKKELGFLKLIQTRVDPVWIIPLATEQITYEINKIIADRERVLGTVSSMGPDSAQYQHASTAESASLVVPLMKQLNVNLDGLKKITKKGLNLWETQF